ncbi:SDR family oxidoreductase [Hymenobacter terrestris]|uniref:SDR family oxidoreductase n=1 Tax=Hymenobacter terrestris TaxID=2748310 RepID=A0ABX2Q6Y5_9BACT|nr:SDR family oxidoreductase [Hymenobacter terrestris]NVO86319.1 SDR family oxidoreductase [Hymenobacter terrestris]
MRVFITGATGFVGSAVVKELIGAGHQVVGLARSEKAVHELAAAGALAHRGDVEDLDSLRRGAAAADAVAHLGFIHDFANFAAVCEIDRRAIEALGSALVGSNRPFIITSGTALITPGRLATENDASVLTVHDFPRIATEEAAQAVTDQGVRVALLRLSPSVHGEGDHGFVPALIGIARATGVSAYVGEGQNYWNAVHRLDAARVFRLALEHQAADARYHAVAEEAITFRAIAEAIGQGLNLPVVSKSPEEAAAHFGAFAGFTQLNAPASSQLTQQRLEWHPTQPTLLADLAQGHYFNGQ